LFQYAWQKIGQNITQAAIRRRACPDLMPTLPQNEMFLGANSQLVVYQRVSLTKLRNFFVAMSWGFY